MVIEKGTRYGRTTEEVRQLGFPGDDESNIKVENEVVLTDDEIREMFPNQHLVLKIVECKDPGYIGYFEKAVVIYFKCEGHFSWDMTGKLMEEHPDELYYSVTNYDPALEGDLLWF